jgi:hypothetical protein
MKTGRTLQELAQEIDRQNKVKKDYVASTADMEMKVSLYGLANAVTRHAQDVESYDRSTELETTAWSMLTMPRNEWEKLNAA